MSAVLAGPEKIVIDEETVRNARSVELDSNATLVVQNADGTHTELPESVRILLDQTLAAVARNGAVAIGTVPDELTSTAAADILGVSRPTLMKWAAAGEIRLFKVGTHTRFERDEVFRHRQLRQTERRKAFAELREIDMQHLEEANGES
ncbi:helix-turn-helix domain-containing protein [Brevibacterium atlanticum]|uniref:helix-turn-helix domain-containing protein n=1 Tax=Brevibacterium atlanticum TaxID=2697563 RepID=UPI001422CE95|nr:helix-turn-helix domain-containing protein [Brevibacterium atlanticum]